ncbi:lamin tail domain-containing protein [Streptomyces sp. NBC_01136]|nr:lamin tail domain-containing protein [Streptomyces sp. NBC_01136]WST81794.1 lamin tail domain-containing protein [Streptomyces sp. NBC_01136]
MLTVAAVAGSAALPAFAADHSSRRGAVEISNVQYNFPGRDIRSNQSLNREWAEVTNTARRAVNLDRWTLSDRDGHTYTFRHYRLDGGSTVRVHTGIGHDALGDVYQDRRTRVWDDRADTATLRDEDGRLVDEVSWGGRRHGDHDGDHQSDRGGRLGGDHRDGRGDRHGDERGDRYDDGAGRHDGRH